MPNPAEDIAPPQMSDLEITRLCAEAMGFSSLVAIPVVGGEGYTAHVAYCPPQYAYCPLEDDAQCMALVKRFRIDLYHWAEGTLAWKSGTPIPDEYELEPDINRAVVECVAKMRSTEAQP